MKITKIKFRIFLLQLLLIFSLTAKANYVLKDSVNSYLNYAEKQFRYNVNQNTDIAKFVRGYAPTTNTLRLVSASDWTSGFYPGIMWLLYDYSGDEFWRNKALVYTNSMNGQQTASGDHDIGFKILGGYGNAYKYMAKDSFASVIITASKKFEKIYNPIVGCTRSWFHTPSRVPTALKPTQFPVIIDNMMNIELLAKGTILSNDPRFLNIARQHALTTSVNHIRSDSSTYHVVEYDPITGMPRWRGTQQGYDHETTWSRGQAWGIYGFTMMYRYTNEIEMLKTAKKLAAYFIKNTPDDGIVLYDFNLPTTLTDVQRTKDVSASCIAASAFVELFNFTSDSLYLKQAEKILFVLSKSPYRSDLQSNGKFILTQSTGGKDYTVNESINYADYYYLEALLRYAKLSNAFEPSKHRPEVKNELNYTCNVGEELSDSIRLYDIDNQNVTCTMATNLFAGSVNYTFINNRIKFVFSKTGIYNFPIRISDANHTVNETIKITVDASTDISKVNIFDNWKLIYQPSINLLSVVGDILPPYEIYNLMGCKVLMSFTPEIDVRALSRGIYILKTSSNGSKSFII
ncbi:MAG: hypothetical protein GZ091_13335 [Paludibacter sp.]|nr:hypothetical protein [Paludibacter sp.]